MHTNAVIHAGVDELRHNRKRDLRRIMNEISRLEDKVSKIIGGLQEQSEAGGSPGGSFQKPRRLASSSTSSDMFSHTPSTASAIAS